MRQRGTGGWTLPISTRNTELASGLNMTAASRECVRPCVPMGRTIGQFVMMSVVAAPSGSAVTGISSVRHGDILKM